MTRFEFRVDQPQPNDLVGNPLLVAGMGGGFEATITLRVLDAEGKAFVETSTMSSNLVSAWQTGIDLPEPLPSTHGVVEAGSGTGKDEAPPRVSVPVFFGPAIVPTFRSYHLYVVQRGDTLSSIAEAETLYAGEGPEPIFEANRDILADPNLIHPGQVLRLPADF